MTHYLESLVGGDIPLTDDNLRFSLVRDYSALQKSVKDLEQFTSDATGMKVRCNLPSITTHTTQAEAAHEMISRVRKDLHPKVFSAAFVNLHFDGVVVNVKKCGQFIVESIQETPPYGCAWFVRREFDKANSLGLRCDVVLATRVSDGRKFGLVITECDGENFLITSWLRDSKFRLLRCVRPFWLFAAFTALCAASGLSGYPPIMILMGYLWAFYALFYGGYCLCEPLDRKSINIKL